jgi:hypothetical protein
MGITRLRWGATTFVLAVALALAGGAAASASVDIPGPTTTALTNVEIHEGHAATLAYRVDDLHGGTLRATLQVTTQSGSVVMTLFSGRSVEAGVRETWTGKLKLQPGSYLYIVHATDSADRPESKATPAALVVQPKLVPTATGIRSAAAFARTRGGTAVSFAVVDSEGNLHGYNMWRECQSASVVKSMLLVQYLRTHGTVDSGMASILARMIEYSDNAATDVVYGIVGSSGLVSLAHTVGMRGFHPYGGWITTRITAADFARYFRDMDRYIPPSKIAFAHLLLSSITPSQRWGIPPAAEPLGYHVYFKGGWLGTYILANQAARLEKGAVRLGLAVFTSGNPPSHYGLETITGVTSRLLR